MMLVAIMCQSYLLLIDLNRAMVSILVQLELFFNPLNLGLSKGCALATLNCQQVMHYNTVLYTTIPVSCMKLCSITKL